MPHHLFTLLALVAALVGLPAIAAEDYLPADLRSRVEQLKVDRLNIPTNQTNAKARAELTWQWVNAFALDNRYVPVNATQVIAFVLANPNASPALIKALDATIHELAYLDQEPRGLGYLTANTGPYVAANPATVTQTYTVGTRPIQTGGGIMVARHFMTNFGVWQVNDPKAPNYISVESNNPRVSFVATTVPFGGMHGGFRNTRATLMFKVASGTLEEGDIVTLRYGDTRSGSIGMTMPTFSSDRMPLPIYVSFADDGHYFSLPIQPIRVIGTDIAGVTGFAPSIVKPGEAFSFSIRARDRFYNRATGDVPNWQILKDGEPWMSLQASEAITLGTATLSEPGAHYLTIVSTDGKIRGEFNPILVTAEDRPRIFWGDTHGHSGFAEGIGTPERFMNWAREDAQLDYVTHSEHDIWLDDAEWETLRDNVHKFTQEGEFVAYLGYEWTVNNIRGGHHNVLFRTPFGRNRIPAQFYPTLSSLYQGLRSAAETKDVVVIPHAHQAGDYRLNDPELEPLIEIMSQHGNFEWFGRMYLKHGHQVGFTAASDNHLSQPGYSAPLGGSLSQRGGLGALLAQEATTDALFDSMKQLKTYATTGDRIIVDFEVNGVSMGERAEFSTQRTISGRVIGTAPIDKIVVFKNDKIFWQKSYLDASDSRLAKESEFLLSFSSASDPFHPNDNPRGWRHWEGTLEIVDGQLESIMPVDASFPLQNIERSTDNQNRLTFFTQTRGDSSSYLIKLSDVSRATRLKFDLIESRETGGAPPVYRPPQRIPADSFVLALKDLQEGTTEHVQTTDGYIDRTMLRRINYSGARQQEFEFTDNGNRQGDYYFMRIEQANDAMAWSSPIWVGGFNKK